MVESYYQGRNELFAQLNTVRAAMNTLLGYDPITFYQGVESPTVAPVDKMWLRMSQQTVIDSQATLNAASTVFTTSGLVFVQLFIPKSPADLYAKGTELAEVISSAFRRKVTPKRIWFRNVRVQEITPESAWFRLNVVSEYEYDKLG